MTRPTKVSGVSFQLANLRIHQRFLGKLEAYPTRIGLVKSQFSAANFVARSLEKLAGDPEVATALKEIRNRLQQTMQATGDACLTDEYDKTSYVGPLKEWKR